jgi:hypothetical protein
MRLSRSEQGSMPMALLVSIVVAGLVAVLFASVRQSEQTVRFDRSFTNAVQVADAGVQDAYHQMNNQLITLDVGQSAGPFTTDLAGREATWTIRRETPRRFEVISTGREADGVERTVVVSLEQESLFFPGAFGDRLVAMNGTSTQIDSYESRSANALCSPATTDLCWGTDPDFGTRKAALGTNNDFDFSGNVKVMRAVLYDWAENPGTGTTAANPGGSRCKGNPCTPEILRFEDDKLDYGSDEQMQFVADKLDACEGRWLNGMKNPVLGAGMKKSDPPIVLSPFSKVAADNEGSPADPGWKNYWCADSLQVLHDVVLHPDASPETPVVIFLRNSYSQAGHTEVHCRSGAAECPKDIGSPTKTTGWRSIRPKAAALQIYVQTEAASKGANVMVDQHGVFAGVMYAPRATCGSSGNAGVHVYGSLICRNIDNVGNWIFHYDDALSDYGRGRYTMASWREEPGQSVAAP